MKLQLAADTEETNPTIPVARPRRFRRGGRLVPLVAAVVGLVLGLHQRHIERSRAEAELVTEAEQISELILEEVNGVTTAMRDLAALVGMGDELVSERNFRDYVMGSKLRELPQIGLVAVIEELPREELSVLLERERRTGRPMYLVVSPRVGSSPNALVLSRFTFPHLELDVPDVGIDLSGFEEPVVELANTHRGESVLIQKFNLEEAHAILAGIGRTDLVEALDFDLTFTIPARFDADGNPNAWAVGLTRGGAFVDSLPPTRHALGVVVESEAAGSLRRISQSGDLSRPLVERFELARESVTWSVQVFGESEADDLAAGLIVASSLLLSLLTSVIGRHRSHAEETSREMAVLFERAHTDPLTGLPNRAVFDRALKEVLEQEEDGYGLVMCDLNDFKPINDNLGHHAGDHVLKVIGERISAVLRPGDHVIRWGGDEFLIVLTRLRDEDEAGAIVERIRARAIEPIDWEGIALRVRVSMGLAFGEQGADPEALLEVADERMYQMKRCDPSRLGRASGS